MSEPDVLTLCQKQDAFGRLPKERREAIAQASIEAFGRNDYKGASTDDKRSFHRIEFDFRRIRNLFDTNNDIHNVLFFLF